MREKDMRSTGHANHAYPVGSMLTGSVASRRAKNASTPLCYVDGTDGKPLGHIWQGTTSPKVRKCTRCYLVQRKNKNGRWENARSVKDARTSEKNVIAIATLWEQLEGE